MQIRSRVIANSQEREEMDLGEGIPVEDLSQVLRALEPVPQRAVQATPQLDLRALAGQLPDLSNLENLTVNIQAN
jgi:hypothetical protein